MVLIDSQSNSSLCMYYFFNQVFTCSYHSLSSITNDIAPDHFQIHFAPFYLFYSVIIITKSFYYSYILIFTSYSGFIHSLLIFQVFKFTVNTTLYNNLFAASTICSPNYVSRGRQPRPSQFSTAP